MNKIILQPMSNQAVIIQAPKDAVVNMKDCKGIQILRI